MKENKKVGECAAEIHAVARGTFGPGPLRQWGGEPGFRQSRHGHGRVYGPVCVLRGGPLLVWKKADPTGLVGFAADFDQSQKNPMASMEAAYGIADEAGRLLWTNRAFSAVIGDEKSARRSLTALFPEITEEGLEKMDHALEVQCAYGSHLQGLYKACDDQSDSSLLSAAPGQKTEQQVLAVYLYDETEIHEYMQAITDQKMVAGLIYLDNYDEALESVEEVRRSLLVALIDRKVSKYISGVNGIVKKMEKDKYFFAIEQKYMPSLEEGRFSLLEDVKTVNIGNEMAVTLSIGIGINGDTYIRNYEYARTAIDMALGRGGDQAVVKNGGKDPVLRRKIPAAGEDHPR